jgi:putative ABC transport system ATP-binding protein
MNLLSVRAVSKAYKAGEVTVPALKNINLEISDNHFVSFIGPSGSGKTTLLNLIGCLDIPCEGEIHINGRNIITLNRKEAAHFRGRTIGFIFQSFNLIPVLTVYENVEYPLIMVRKIPASERTGFPVA